MSKYVDFIADVDAILVEVIGFDSSDCADVDWAALSEGDAHDAALIILQDEGYPLELLQSDATGRLVL